MKWLTIVALCFLLESVSPLNRSTHKSLHKWPNDDVLTLVTPAKFCRRLRVIKTFTQSIALTRKMCIIVNKKTMQRNHMFAILALLLEDTIFGYWLPPRFSLIPNIWKKTPFLSWYLMSQVLFSSFQFKFAQYYTWVMKNIAKHTKLLNIFCIVYKLVKIS